MIHGLKKYAPLQWPFANLISLDSIGILGNAVDTNKDPHWINEVYVDYWMLAAIYFVMDIILGNSLYISKYTLFIQFNAIPSVEVPYQYIYIYINISNISVTLQSLFTRLDPAMNVRLGDLQGLRQAAASSNSTEVDCITPWLRSGKQAAKLNSP